MATLRNTAVEMEEWPGATLLRSAHDKHVADARGQGQPGHSSREENTDYDRYELRTLQRIVRACGGQLAITREPEPLNHRAV